MNNTENKISADKVSISEISVYDLDVHSMMELYYELAKKLNEVIGGFDDLWDIVRKKLEDMLEDGSLEEVINKDLFKSLSDLIATKLPLTGGEMQGALSTSHKIYFNGNVGENGFICKNNSEGRDELLIYSTNKAYLEGSNGAGMHLYGNDDVKHPGCIGFLVGEKNKGTIKAMIDQEGKMVIGNEIISYTDNHENPGLLTLKNPKNSRPAIYITETSEDEGEIAVAPHEIFRLGCYDKSNGFKEWLRVSENFIRFKDQNLVVKGKNIQSRKESITPVANERTTVTIEFDEPFDSVPVVTVSPVTTVFGTTLTECNISNITNTGFDLTLFRTNNTKTSVNWIAIA